MALLFWIVPWYFTLSNCCIISEGTNDFQPLNLNICEWGRIWKENRKGIVILSGKKDGEMLGRRERECFKCTQEELWGTHRALWLLPSCSPVFLSLAVHVSTCLRLFINSNYLFIYLFTVLMTGQTAKPWSSTGSVRTTLVWLSARIYVFF